MQLGIAEENPVGRDRRLILPRRLAPRDCLEIDSAGRDYVTLSGSFDERASAARRLVGALVRYE